MRMNEASEENMAVIQNMSLLNRQAPNFTGVAVIDGEFKEIQSSNFQGKYLVLVFYPYDL